MSEKTPEENGWTTISLKKDTKRRLEDLMHKSDNYDPFINKLIDLYEGKAQG